jgi:magnesium transporter
MNFAVTQDYIDWLKEAIEDQNDEAILQSMQGEYPADINTVLYQVTADEAKYVMRLLDKKIVAQIISELETDVRKKFLEKAYKPEELAELLDFIDTDDAADILNEQSVKYKEETIAHIQDEQHATNILELLRYDEDCAGGYMQKEMVKANVNWTVQECIEEIRRQAEEVEKVYSVYVVNNQDKLLGRIALKKLILTKPQVPIAHIYEKDLVAVESYMPIQEVAELMQRYDLDAVPVINVQGKLLGRITIDDIVDAITEQAETDLQAISGISEDTDYEDTAWQGARARLPWLIIGMAGGMLAAMVMGLFEAELTIIPAMAFFTPLIAATGGNVGIQSATVMVQNIEELAIGGILKKVTKVLLIALLNGIVIAGLVFLFVLLMGRPAKLGIVVSVALFSVVILASLMGTLVPVLLHKFGINPAFASGPFITTANDLLGITVYFSVARLILDF